MKYLENHREKWQTSVEGGGFNPFETCLSNWIISPSRDENKKHLKPPPNVGKSRES